MKTMQKMEQSFLKMSNTHRIPHISANYSLFIIFCFVISSIASYYARPKLAPQTKSQILGTSIPHQFGDWKELPTTLIQANVINTAEPDLNQPYDQIVMRTYENSHGDQVMLALAWGENQRQEVKIHRPDLCYVAQGYRIISQTPHSFTDIKTASGASIHGHRIYAEKGNIGEAISYWIRIGDIYSESAFDTRFHILREGLKGRIIDGILVRASMIVERGSKQDIAWDINERFLRDLTDALDNETKEMLTH